MKLKSLYQTVVNPYLYLGRHRHVLLLSHMRCYSSLLGHIFGSNPLIAGFAELHMPYVNQLDLLRMRKRIHDLTQEKGERKSIFFDKLLHNECFVSKGIAGLDSVKFVVSVRRPRDTIASIINMGRKHHDIGWYQDPIAVVNYYVKRLSVLSTFLSEYPEVSGRRAIFFPAEKLLSQPSELLTSLSTSLGLATPLCEEYSTFNATGRPGIGDPSSNIRAGRIVRNTDEQKPLEIDASLTQLVDAAYESCISLANRHCLVI